MITSTLDQLYLYKTIHPNLEKAIDFILSTDFTAFSPGKYAVDGDDIFFMINEYSTKPAVECEPEKHRVYTDIQIMLTGQERFGYTPFTGQQPSTDFLPENDVAFYTIPEMEINYITLSPGQFILFFPSDIHQPEVCVDGPTPVKKLVFKIKC